MKSTKEQIKKYEKMKHDLCELLKGYSEYTLNVCTDKRIFAEEQQGLHSTIYLLTELISNLKDELKKEQE
jgi:hypothetical protein